MITNEQLEQELATLKEKVEILEQLLKEHITRKGEIVRFKEKLDGF